MELPDDADTQKIDTEYCIWPRGHPEADIAATESAAYGPQFRFIRGRRPSHPRVDTSLAGTLTDREHEVLVLMARGLDNIQIGAELFGGEATVRTHVGHDLSRLEARSRVQAWWSATSPVLCGQGLLQGCATVGLVGHKCSMAMAPRIVDIPRQLIVEMAAVIASGR
jgi:DNA-binding CsgD family transcriptional regulator